MKKAIFTIILCLLCILSGCSTDAIAQEQGEMVLAEYLNTMDEYDTSVREFGTPASYTALNKKIAIGIFYPETNMEFLDIPIRAWIDSVTEKYTGEANSAKKTKEFAELTISYESYCIGDSVVSIKMSGTFSSPHSSHPVDILQVFNADIKEERILSDNDILSTEQKEEFTTFVIDTANIDPSVIDHGIFNNILLKDNGIELLLSTNLYLSETEGIKSLFFSYSEISSFLNKDFIKQLCVSDPSLSLHFIDPNKPMLALTFDDGPSEHTERLLDIFKQYGGSATFFVVGNMIEHREKTLQRIVNENHEIGNHSWNHRQLTYLNQQEITDQIMMTRAKIYDVTGVDCLIVRPPYGAYNDTLKAVGAELGVHYINWSVDTLDWKSRNAQAVYDEVFAHASDGAIILCHDLHSSTVDAMEIIIPKLINDGYQLVTVSQLLSYSDKPIVSGNLYYKQ